MHTCWPDHRLELHRNRKVFLGVSEDACMRRIVVTRKMFDTDRMAESSNDGGLGRANIQHGEPTVGTETISSRTKP